MAQNTKRRKSSTYGFKRAETLLNTQIRKASETRGFAQSRVLTHWEEIVGAELASMSRPVEIKYGPVRLKGKTDHAHGAKLIVLTRGAFAPMLEMRRDEIRQRINGVYGYEAIRHVIITQTAPTGFAEGQVDFEHRKARPPHRDPRPEAISEARGLSQQVGDEDLRAALERLGANVISKAGRGRPRPKDT